MMSINFALGFYFFFANDLYVARKIFFADQAVVVETHSVVDIVE